MAWRRPTILTRCSCVYVYSIPGKEQTLQEQPNLTHSQEILAEFLACDGQGWGLAPLNGLAYSAGSVVTSRCTCLNGVVHIGRTARVPGEPSGLEVHLSQIEQ